MRHRKFSTLLLSLMLTGCSLPYYPTYRVSTVPPVGRDTGVRVEVAGRLVPEGLWPNGICLTVRNWKSDTIAVVWDSAQFVGLDSAVRRLVSGHVPATAIPPNGALRTLMTVRGAHRFENFLLWPDSKSDRCNVATEGAELLPLFYSSSPRPIEEKASRLVGRTFEFVIPVQVGQRFLRYSLIYRIDAYTLRQRSHYP
jgi:hypothetical protein